MIFSHEIYVQIILQYVRTLKTTYKKIILCYYNFNFELKVVVATNFVVTVARFIWKFHIVDISVEIREAWRSYFRGNEPRQLMNVTSWKPPLITLVNASQRLVVWEKQSTERIIIFFLTQSVIVIYFLFI